MTANQKTEKYLNEFYSNNYSEEKAVDLLQYIAVKGRSGGNTTIKNIRNAYNNYTLGTLVRKYDKIAFECIKSDLNLR